jgi:hypothetical protein
VRQRSRTAADEYKPRREPSAPAKKETEMFESRKTGRTAAVALAATLGMIGAARAQTLGACGLAGCTDVAVAQLAVDYVSPPDMAIQFSTCLSSPLPAFVIGSVHDGLAAAMTDLDLNHDDPAPNPDVRHACIGGRSVFGAWLHPAGSYGGTDTDTARNVGLGTVNLLAGGETVAFNVTHDGIDRLVQIRWQDQPKQLDDDGNADPNGRVHLGDSFNMIYNDHDAIFDYDSQRIVTGPSIYLTVDGYYDYIQDTDIRLYIDDFLTLTPFGALQCKTYAAAVPTETTIDTILASLTGGGGSSLGDVVSQGPGCKIASLLPRTVLLPTTSLKVLFSYSRVDSLDATGLTFAGTWTPSQRQGSLWINGPTILTQDGTLPFTGTWSVTASDLRPPFTVSWTAIGAAPVSGQNLMSATMTWDLPTLTAGQQTSRNVVVTVTDADGVSAQRIKPITLSRVTVADGGINPLCKHKPWLPQCQL